MKEKEFIHNIAKSFHSHSALLTKGIGDDCAVFGCHDTMEWLISTDLLVENVHFVLDWHDPYKLGRKCVAVNLSDIAAMGGTPHFVLFSLSLPQHVDDSWLIRWQEGAASILTQYDCSLIGGDTTSGEILTVNVVILGRGKKNEILYRSGAREGQDIYVTGLLGSSAAGLEILKRGSGCISEYQDLVEAHLNPEPQVQTGKLLSKSGYVSAMQDISDGLATDLSHICTASGTGAVISREMLPVSVKTAQAATHCNVDHMDLVLQGGEDYQLVFTAEKRNREGIESLAENYKLSITRVGKITAGSDVFLQDARGSLKNITFCGFEHQS